MFFLEPEILNYGYNKILQHYFAVNQIFGNPRLVDKLEYAMATDFLLSS